MHVHMYGVVLLFLLTRLSASRVRLAADKVSNEGLFVPVPGVEWVPGVTKPAIRLHGATGFEFRGGAPDDGPETSMELLRQQLERTFVSKPSPPIDFSKGFQVFTDLEDTLVSSGGDLPGTDESFYKHERYPGAFQFVLELSIGPETSSDHSKVVPISSRPEELKAVLGTKWSGADQNYMQRAYEEIMTPEEAFFRILKEPMQEGVTGKPIVLLGDNSELEQKRREVVFEKRTHIMPLTARLVMEAGDRLQAAFIHDVRRGKRFWMETTIEQLGLENVYMFDTFYDAAKIALDLGLISEEGMKRVEDSFASSAIVQMCQNQEMFTDGRYPCMDTEKGILVDAVTLEPVPEVLGLNIKDGTADFPECESNDAGEPMYIVPPEDASRCISISRVMASL